MKYSTLRKDIIENDISNSTLSEISAIIEKLKYKKANFEAFLKVQNVLYDRKFLSYYLKYFDINYDEIYNTYYGQKFEYPVFRQLKVNEYDKFFYSRHDALVLGHKKCMYGVVCDLTLKLDENKEYTKQEILDLVNSGKIIITKGRIPYGEVIKDADPIEVNKDSDIVLEPEVIASKYITKAIREEMSTQNLNNAFNEYCNRLEEYKEKIMERLYELKEQKQKEMNDIKTTIDIVKE